MIAILLVAGFLLLIYVACRCAAEADRPLDDETMREAMGRAARRGRERETWR